VVNFHFTPVYLERMLARSHMKSIWMGLLVLALSSCTPTPKTISGTVQIAGTSTQATRPQPAAVPEFVPGEVLVTFKTNLSAQSLSSLSVNGIALRSVRASSLERTSLYRSDTVRSQAGTLALVAQLKSRKDIAWAEPNQILRANVVPGTPNDTFFNKQWHLNAINLPQAWDLETGSNLGPNPNSSPVTVAVVDTGLLTGHPDIQGKFWPGYDFISSTLQSNDGDGRDANPDDPGKDNPDGSSSYHGSHVAGTIAAATNNGTGIAGVSWGAKILPVRVLGVDGGSTSDIIDGILWAAGVPVAGVPSNPNPAQIINLSLGGSGLCEAGSTLQRTFDQVNSRGAIAVVAAGNENVEAADTIPASCSGVITVGATNKAGSRAASYSNYGPRVDVMAPGGENAGGNPADEVLSLDKIDGPGGGFGYGYKQGTSMATPHVAGVLALLKSKDPTLNFSRALSILKRTARPLTALQCSGTGTGSKALFPSDCGAGLIDAFAALNALGTNPDFSLTLKPSSVIAVPGQTVQIQVSQANLGTVSAASLQLLGTTAKLTGSISNSTISLTLASNIPFGTYALKVQGTANGLNGLTRDASLSLNVIDTNAPAPPQADLKGTSIVFCYYDAANDACVLENSGTLIVGESGTRVNYQTPQLTPGTYQVWACKDTNNDKKCGTDELYGEYIVGSGLGLVNPPATGINITLDVKQSNGLANNRHRVFPNVWGDLR
jgi:serine protease